MTYLEKVLQDIPGVSERIFVTFECPHTMYEADRPGDEYCGSHSSHSCRECWNREYKGEKIR